MVTKKSLQNQRTQPEENNFNLCYYWIFFQFYFIEVFNSLYDNRWFPLKKKKGKQMI